MAHENQLNNNIKVFYALISRMIDSHPVVRIATSTVYHYAYGVSDAIILPDGKIVLMHQYSKRLFTHGDTFSPDSLYGLLVYSCSKVQGMRSSEQDADEYKWTLKGWVIA